jgi:hypothetical protein
MHLTEKDENGNYRIIATATSHPKDTMETKDFGPGLIKYPDSNKHQYFVNPDKTLVIPPENVQNVPEGPKYIENNDDKFNDTTGSFDNKDNPKEIRNFNEYLYKEDFFSQDPEKSFEEQSILKKQLSTEPTHDNHKNFDVLTKISNEKNHKNN